MGPKYEFTDETKSYDGHILHRIRRLSDGKIGGWLEKEENLSQEGNCWVDADAIVYNNAKVYDNAQVYGNAVVNDAKVSDDAKVYDDAVILYGQIYGNAEVYGNAFIVDKAQIYGNTKVYDNAQICGEAQVYENALVYGHTLVSSDAKVYGNAKVYDDAGVDDNAQVFGNAEVYDNAVVYGYALVSGDAKVYNNAIVHDQAKIYGNAQICGNAIFCGTAKVYGNIKITNGKYTNREFSCDVDLPKTDESNKVIQDFIYKIDDSNKLKVKTEYSSIDEYFNSSYQNDIKLDTLIIGTIDTKIPLIKLEKIEKDEQLKYKFIVDLTTKNEDHFLIQTFIETKEQLSQKLTQTIDALNQYPEFNKYIDDLSNCLCD